MTVVPRRLIVFYCISAKRFITSATLEQPNRTFNQNQLKIPVLSRRSKRPSYLRIYHRNDTSSANPCQNYREEKATNFPKPARRPPFTFPDSIKPPPPSNDENSAHKSPAPGIARNLAPFFRVPLISPLSAPSSSSFSNESSLFVCSGFSLAL